MTKGIYHKLWVFLTIVQVLILSFPVVADVGMGDRLNLQWHYSLFTTCVNRFTHHLQILLYIP